MWWGKEDEPMYHMDGTPANEAARRGGPRYVQRCAPVEKAYDDPPVKQRFGLKKHGPPLADDADGIDLTRTSFATKVYYEIGVPLATVPEGSCLVCTLPTTTFLEAAVSTGHQDELFVGFKMGRVHRYGGHDGPMVTIGGGHFRIYTLCYDKKAEWFIGIKCLPIAGPDGKVTTGVFPDDQYRAIGRVIQLPTKDDPYLGIAGFAHT